MGFIDKICEGCQTTFQALTNTRRYCDNCRYDRRRQTTDRHNVKRTETRKLLIQAADNSCDICGDIKTDNLLVIDHDHACCAPARACVLCVRGVLCKSCNTGLGSFKGRIELMEAAINYLKNFAQEDRSSLDILDKNALQRW